jgi:hypothetical protein
MEFLENLLPLSDNETMQYATKKVKTEQSKSGVFLVKIHCY